MDNIIYSWLLNSKETSPKLINCILILSCNDLYISYDNLFKYHNENVNISTSPANLKKLNGLNEKQFNILRNNIDQLEYLFNNYNNNNNNNDINIDICNKNNKFNWSINIIIDNNNSIDSNVGSISGKTTKSINIITDNNQKVIEKDQLFFQVWRNSIIRNAILFHSRLYSIHLRITKTSTLQELNEYKYKSYIHKLKLTDIEQEDEILKSNSIPHGVKCIEFISSIQSFQMNSIPDSVTNICFPKDFNQIITSNTIPNTVTTIKFTQFNQSLDGKWLPKSIKHLNLGDTFQQPIYPGQLPDSLTELILPNNYRGVIISGSIPSSVNNLYLKLLNVNNIPISTTKLELDNLSGQIIKTIPHNVTKLKLKTTPARIEPNSLPLSLLSLSLSCYSHVGTLTNVLPPNLTYLDMGGNVHQLSPNLFPRSIKTLIFPTLNQVIPLGYFYSYSNLIRLDIGDFRQNNIPLKTLPKSLTHLDLSLYEGPIDAILELKSLKTLFLGGTQREIITGQLPSSIETLGLSTLLPIGPNLLPPNLKELYFDNPDFNHDISTDGYLPASLKIVYIKHDFLNLINCLNPDFFSKYIRFFGV